MTMLWVILLLLIVLAMLLAGVVWMMANTLLCPPRMTDGKALHVLGRIDPSDLGLDFEPITFKGEGIQLAGWWIPLAARSTQTAVLVHGYADAKVGAIAWAPLFQQLGFNILAIDLRAHGESDGRFCTGGDLEHRDLLHALHQARLQFPDATQQLLLFGISLGGAICLAAAANHDPADLDLRAVITDSMFADYEQAAMCHGELIGVPVPGLMPLALKFAQWRADCDFQTASPIRSLKSLPCPALLINGQRDPYVPPDQIARLQQALQSRNRPQDQLVLLENASHVDGLIVEPARYAGVLSDFVSQTCQQQTSPSS